jgi:hypothetical protein
VQLFAQTETRWLTKRLLEETLPAARSDWGRFCVDARPDPTRDPDVRGLINAQAQSTRRIAQSQVDNFFSRLERLHGSGRRAGFDNSLGFASRRETCDVGGNSGQLQQSALNPSACRDWVRSHSDGASAEEGDRRLKGEDTWRDSDAGTTGLIYTR